MWAQCTLFPSNHFIVDRCAISAKRHQVVIELNHRSNTSHSSCYADDVVLLFFLYFYCFRAGSLLGHFCNCPLSKWSLQMILIQWLKNSLNWQYAIVVAWHFISFFFLYRRFRSWILQNFWILKQIAYKIKSCPIKWACSNDILLKTKHCFCSFASIAYGQRSSRAYTFFYNRRIFQLKILVWHNTK